MGLIANRAATIQQIHVNRPRVVVTSADTAKRLLDRMAAGAPRTKRHRDLEHSHSVEIFAFGELQRHIDGGGLVDWRHA